ncbi:MAG TPA: ABC transporter substrate-binding protein [Actinospica sp.]|jgi:peptide/nickel transport system substrate-binding protein|nr:ABC transporter substrate-binding protein [Actinospica sp.]
MDPHRRRRPTLALAVALTGVLAAAACTSGGGSAKQATNATIPLLNWALPNAPASLDYAKSYDNNSTGAIMSLVTEPLERVSSTGTFTPVLATSVAQPNATTIVYTLRSGVKFSDGTALTAQDVAWSIEHFSAATAQTSALGQDVTSAEVTGPLQVTVHLGAAVPTARAGIDITTLVEEAKFAKAHAATLGNPGVSPVGTGPYQIASQTADSIILVRNPDYARTKPAPDKVVFSVISNDNSRQLAMRAGSIDGGPVTDLRSGAEWKAVPGATVYASQSLNQDFVALDTSKAPFNDVHVRRAIAYSVDRAGIAHAAFGSFAAPLTALVPAQELAGVAGSESAASSFLASLPQYPVSESAAKTELAQSAYPNGFSATIQYVSDQPWEEVAAESIQQNLKPLGVTITLKAVTSDQWYSQFFQHQLTGINLPFDFGAGYPDPASLLGKLVGSTNIGAQKLNMANWVSTAVDQAQAVVAVAGPNSDRWQATKTILSAVADQVPYVPLFTEDEVYVTRAGFAVSGGQLSQFTLSNGDWIFLIKATA